ncbi:jg21048 [Pararge aegeria aegeria]|uniref:Jg21048 protein n=1 Tax=Pararge aegeria aegeria TaxID=348720 RepID=A0A8S4RQZ8_9NEOP|nr:jg21048 [Pararge aegeria aegeria]
MQENQSLTSCSKNTCSKTSHSLDSALAKPVNEELFYTASVHFLKKRLQDKIHFTLVNSESGQTSQSCCNLSSISENHSAFSEDQRKNQSHLEIQENSAQCATKSLSMHQILPFPKSNKECFIARIMNSLRKYKRCANIPENKTDDIELFKTRSNYKFPRCELLNKGRSSCLKAISEELSKETLETRKSYTRSGKDSR